MKGTGRSAPCGFRSLVVFSAFWVTAVFFGMRHLSAQEISAFENGSLRRFIDDEGSFFSGSAQSRTLRSADGLLVEKRFDSLSRLIEKIVWKTDKAEPLSLIEYVYEDDALFPASALTTDNENKRIIHERFTDTGLLLKRDTYTIEDKSATRAADADKAAADSSAESGSPSAAGKNSDEKNKKLFSGETFRYDEDNRLIEEIIEYAALSAANTQNSGQKGSAAGTKRIEKKAYRYAEGGSYPDEFYYRNGDKIRQKIYASPTDWEETVFFAGGIRIVRLYKNETPVSETVYENDVKKRERAL